jgi:hypothetical protein
MRKLRNAFDGLRPGLGLLVLAALVTACAADGRAPATAGDGEQTHAPTVRFLEIVTPEAEATCETLSLQQGITCSEPVAELGNARVASLSGGGRISVRAPLASHESPVVRPYLLVADIESAVQQAAASGAEIAHPPLEIPGQGTFAIYILGGIQHGLWQD